MSFVFDIDNHNINKKIVIQPGVRHMCPAASSSSPPPCPWTRPGWGRAPSRTAPPPPSNHPPRHLHQTLPSCTRPDREVCHHSSRNPGNSCCAYFKRPKRKSPQWIIDLNLDCLVDEYVGHVFSSLRVWKASEFWLRKKSNFKTKKLRLKYVHFKDLRSWCTLEANIFAIIANSVNEVEGGSNGK